MSVEEIYKLPDQKQESAAGVFMQTISVLLGITVLACWLATQYAAYKLAYQDSLGQPLWATASGFKLYMPFDFFMWMMTFGHVEGTEAAWDGGEKIIFSLHFLFIPAIWLAIRRAKKFGGKTDLHGSAHWATKEEILYTGLLKTELKGAAGVYVGAWVDPSTGAKHYLTHDGPEHILAFAPTRSGKGVGLVLPTLLSWPGSCLVHDIKGEAWALTSGYRKAKGQKVLKFEPSNDDGSSIRFNPLEEIRLRTMREVADAQNVAQMIVDPDGKGMDDHWAKTGHELLSGALLHILYSGRNKTLRGLISFFCNPSMTMEQVAESMLNTEHDDPLGSQKWEDPITGKPTKVHPVIAESARSFLNKADNERSGVQSTAMSFLSLYRDPIVAMNTAVSEFKICDLMNQDCPVSLYLVVPPNDMARLRPLIRLMINQILRQTMEKMDFADGRTVAGYKHRLLMMLDEFPALGKLDLVEQSMAFVAGYGIKYYLITQDLTQLTKAYTKDESIMSNCHIRIAYAPNKVETADVLSKYCGMTTIRKDSRSYSGSRLNPFLMHVMAAEQETQRPLLTADECLRLPGAVKNADGSMITEAGDMLIFSAGTAPIYGKQMLHFKDPIFLGRSKIKAPRTSDRITIRQEVKTAPIACDPALAAVFVPARKSELDDFVKVDNRAGLPVVPTGVALVTVAAAATIAAAAEAPQLAKSVPLAASPAPACEYTAEELAIVNAEEEEETEVDADSNATIEAEMKAETEDANPAAKTGAASDGNDLLNFPI